MQNVLQHVYGQNPEWTKSRKTKFRSWKNPEVQNPELDKIPNGQTHDLDQILNGQNPGLDKISNEQNPELDKIPKWTKSRMDKILSGFCPYSGFCLFGILFFRILYRFR